MKISHEFEVARPVDAVWGIFQDIQSVAHCLPGADLTADHGGGSYAGLVQVKLGPMTAKFEGEATVTADATTNSAHIDGRGVDRQGGSQGHVQVDYSLATADGGTRVNVDADIHLSGAIAQFGRTGLVEEMSRRLIDEFVECLHAKLDAGTAEEAATIQAGEVSGISLFFSSLASWIGSLLKRLFGRGKQG